MEVSTDDDSRENPSMRRITTVLEEAVCTENPKNTYQQHVALTGTTLNKRPSTQLCPLPCAMSVATCEQPTQQTVTDPFIEQPTSSTFSGEQSLDQTMVISGGNSNVESSMSLSQSTSTSNSSLNPDIPTTSAVPPVGMPKMQDPSSDQLSTAAAVKDLNSFLKPIKSEDHDTAHTNNPQHPVPTIVIVPTVEGEELLFFVILD